jgi:uncharacterized RDD family membrane protein YckC
VSVLARRRGRPVGLDVPVAVVAETPAVVVPAPADCIGLITRVFAFGIDLAIINVVALLTSGLIGLLYSIVSVPDDLRAGAIVAAGTAYLIWAVGYFVTFWTTTGQTPGNRVLRIRVCASDGGRLLPRRALLRFIGLTLAALPLFAGFALILVDSRRRGLQDFIARSLVIDAREKDDAAGAAADG